MTRVYETKIKRFCGLRCKIQMRQERGTWMQRHIWYDHDANDSVPTRVDDWIRSIQRAPDDHFMLVDAVECVVGREMQYDVLSVPITGATKPLPDPERMNDERACWAEYALGKFKERTGTDDEDAMSDLLSDLIHLAHVRGESFANELRRALGHFAEETDPAYFNEG
jgi:hypothetical protein